MRYRVILIALAPTRPPCFTDRDSWVSYLEGAQADSRAGHPGPLLLDDEDRPRFNLALNFCGECTIARAQDMDRRGRCNPDHLKALAASTEPE